MLKPVRRIVTGHDAAGRSVVVSDGPSPHQLENPVRPGRGLTDLWRTDCVPASNAGDTDAADRPVTLNPPERGSVFRFFQINPAAEEAELSAEEREARYAQAFDAMGASTDRHDTSRHPGMHQTRTVDYIILLDGEVTLVLDEGEVEMKPFDVVIQRGTNHAWINKGSGPAVRPGVLIDADEL
ncbi:MAG: cupin domain-containing protein [Alphaproteobacteria bacterium]|nr:cupin domain-containing protein [Alphaproteobacteria bacterium]